MKKQHAYVVTLEIELQTEMEELTTTFLIKL